MHKVSDEVSSAMPEVFGVTKETTLLPYALLLDLGSKGAIWSDSQITTKYRDFSKHLGLVHALTPAKGGVCCTHSRTG